MNALISITASMKQFASMAELNDFLRLSDVPRHELGKDANAPLDFFCIKVCKAESVVAHIGVVSFGVGIKPDWLFRDGKLLVGFNDRIAIFDLNGFKFEREVCLSSLFYEFVTLNLEPARHVCVVCETAIVAVLSDGSDLWRVDTDLITNFEVSERIIKLEFSDAPPIQLDLYSGKPS